MKIKIHVTKEILERSRFCKHPGEVANGKEVRTSCAVSLAIREMFPDAEVYCFGIVLDGPYELSHIDSLNPKAYTVYWGKSTEIALWIERFDILTPERRAGLSPISFEIDVPSEVIDKIGIGEVYRILSESKTLELVSI